MDKIVKLVADMDSGQLGILITAVIGFLAWLVKSLIEAPIDNAKETYYKTLQNRVETLTKIKNILTFISLFPEERKYKILLQEMLLGDGKTAYVDQKCLVDVLQVSVTENIDNSKVLSLITEINSELKLWIEKAREENNFYDRYYSTHPFKRIYNLTKLGVINSIIIIGLVLFISISCYYLLFTGWLQRITIMIVFAVLIYLFERK